MMMPSSLSTQTAILPSVILACCLEILAFSVSSFVSILSVGQRLGGFTVRGNLCHSLDFYWRGTSSGSWKTKTRGICFFLLRLWHIKVSFCSSSVSSLICCVCVSSTRIFFFVCQSWRLNFLCKSSSSCLRWLFRSMHTCSSTQRAFLVDCFGRDFRDLIWLFLRLLKEDCFEPVNYLKNGWLMLEFYAWILLLWLPSCSSSSLISDLQDH